jgi:hypothetical protein
MADLTEAQRKILDRTLAKEEERQREQSLVPTQRTRTAMQGLTLGFADEIEARARALATGETYEEALDKIRSGIKAYQEARPTEAMAYELGGAVAPMLFTGGGAAVPTLGRLAARGAAEGAVYAFGTGEGGAAERAARVPSGAAFGAGGSVVGGKVAQYGIQGVEALVDAARRTTGRKGASVVENEIQRLVEQTGKTPEQIVQDIVDGKILAENRTIAASVKALRGQGGPAAATIQTALEQRPRRLRSAAQAEISKYLDDVGGDPSVSAARRRATSEKATREAEQAAYAPFKKQTVDDDVFLALSNALESVPEAGDTLLKIARRNRVKGLYRINEDGEVIFARKPSVSEAERIRRVINERAQKEGKDIDFELGEATKGVEQEVRSALDVSVPDLMSTRAQAAAVRSNRDAFTAGRKALTGDVNEVMVELEDKWARNPETLASFRAGFLAALQGKFTKGTERSTLRNLLEEGRAEGMMLRALVPDPQDQAQILRKLDIAVEGEDVSQVVLRNTQTAETQMAAKAQNAGVSLAESMAAYGGDVNSLLSISRKFVDSFSRDLTDAERQKIAEILVSENPDLVLRAITDDRAIAQAQQFISRITPFVTKSGATFGAREAAGPTSDVFGPPLEPAAQSVLGAITR